LSADGKVLPRWVSIALQACVSAGLIVALALIVDWDAMRTALQALSFSTVLIGFVIYFGSQVVMVPRWRALISALGVHEPPARSWHTIFGGLFLQNFLPGSLGTDGLRVIMLSRACGSAATAMGAIIFDRAMQLVFYGLLIAVVLVWPIPALPPRLHAAIFVCAVLGVLLVIGIFWWLGGRAAPVGTAQSGLLRKGVRLLSTMMIETGRMQLRLRRHRTALIAFWFWSLVSSTLIFGIFYALLLDMGHELGLPAIILIASVSAIVTGIPISVGGVGPYEATVVVLFGLFGVPVAHAFLMALTIRVIVVAVNLTGLPSALLLWRERRLPG
jgi:uncharacterized protein (TIRG00374 family)